jgi:DNA mismatch endonuclease (patch repair protein)
MHPHFPTDPATSARMKHVRQRDTKPERELRRWLWSRGVRFTTYNNDLPGSPDIANRRGRWAIFVHGCFWHGHSECTGAKLPKRNTEAWRTKIETNKARDCVKAEELAALGFITLTVWECEIKRLQRHNTLFPSATLRRLRRR